MPRPHPPEFRRRAVELAREGVKPISQIAADLEGESSARGTGPWDLSSPEGLRPQPRQADVTLNRRSGPSCRPMPRAHGRRRSLKPASASCRKHDPVQVREPGLEWLGLLRRRGGKHRRRLTGKRPRQHRVALRFSRWLAIQSTVRRPSRLGSLG